MMKDNFLRELEDTLRGEVADSVYRDTVQYYSSYIDSEVRKGRSEKEVVESLGSGRIIAKTVIDTQAKGQAAGQAYYANNYSQGEKESNVKVPFAAKAKTIAIIIAILVVVIALAGIVIHVIWALLPMILIIALIVWLVKRI